LTLYLGFDLFYVQVSPTLLLFAVRKYFCFKAVQEKYVRWIPEKEIVGTEE
jgi:hypothetical protein